MSEQDLSGAPAGGGFDPAGRAVAAGRGIEWLKQGWQLFVKNPGTWLAIAVIMTVIIAALSLIPVVGHLAMNLLMPVFSAGMLLGCKCLREGGELRIDHLFAGFRQRAGELIIVGVFCLIGVAGAMLVTFLVGGAAAFTGAMMGHGPGVGMAVGGFFLAMLVMLALLVPVAMAVWFAPALVIFRGMAPLQAMKASFFACLKNIAPFLVYGVIVFVLGVVAMIPFGLGFLVLVPVMVGSVYAAYVEIFE